MRILPPEDFGIIAKILIVLTFFNVFLDLGYSQAIIQQKNPTRRSLSSHFYLGSFIGIILGLILFLSSSFLANYFNSQEIGFPLKLFSITLIIGGTVLVHRTILLKEMQFKKLAIIDIASLTITGILAIYLAISGWGYLAIVIQLFSNSVIQAILYWIISSFRPSLHFNYSDIKKTSTFSVFVFFSEIINYISNVLDQFLAAIYFNTNTLGLYNRSVSLIKNTASIIPATSSAVLFPLFSKIDSDTNKDQNEIQIRSTGIISFIFTPLLFIYFFFTEQFVQLILGDNWLDIIPFTKILSLVSILIVTKVGGILLLSKAKTKELFYMNLANKTILIIAILIGIQFGLTQVLWSILIAEVIIRIITLLTIKNLLNFDIKKYIFTLIIPLIIGFILAFILFTLSQYLSLKNWIVIPVIIVYCIYILFSIVLLKFQYAKDTKMIFTSLLNSNK